MINKVTLLGNLGKDPEVKELENGKMVKFSMATSESYKDREGNKQTKTEWHNIVVWGKLAEIAEKYLKKGSKLYLEGKITTRSWEDEGQTKYMTEIVAREFTMLGEAEKVDVKKLVKELDLEKDEPKKDDLPF